MFRKFFDQAEDGSYSELQKLDAYPAADDMPGATYIFSSISDALSRAYDSARETMIEAADKVTDTVSSAAETVSDAASEAYDASKNFASDLGTKLENEDGSLNYWAIAGGAVIGVAAVAAVPFTGGGSLLGAASLAGSLAGGGAVAAAVGAGVAGAVIGAHVGDDTAKREQYEQQGYAKGKADNAAVVEQLRQKLQLLFTELKSAGKFFDGIVAMQAVAIAAANCDGEICDAEKQNIEMFISGLSAAALPASVIAQITDLYETPPSLRMAFKLAHDSGIDMPVFDEIIQVVVHSDGQVLPAENVFMQAWNELKAA
ncbi:hypothetical protein [Pseudomonas japonica]|uniref:hypothetical protein n=1 Tax=Pseudomonas japonica TaxID=256466 RepID=UPI0015E29D37|nr:hypothetical protein [Pseudomonas japonica]MBA1245542.1 hypothetical protein [Pseudomonas japonica]